MGDFLQEGNYSLIPERLGFFIPWDVGNAGIVCSSIGTDSEVGHGFWMEEGHGWIEAAMEARERRNFFEESQKVGVGIIERCDDISDYKTTADEKESELKRVGVQARSDCDGARAKISYGANCSFRFV